ncbi:transposase [Belnapia sp. T18]|uniref:Transposase n=1 Tax=Belnapia arida TaxID=2804533 RepID=A0ABS1UHK7_9PROT|nr:transposase [Belnapia arida]
MTVPLCDLFVEREPPGHIRSDKGPGSVGKEVCGWLGRVGVKTLFIEPGSAWENGYNASFNGKPRDELLDPEIFYSLREAEVLISAGGTTTRPGRTASVGLNRARP